jgi:hypothetical protein
MKVFCSASFTMFAAAVSSTMISSLAFVAPSVKAVGRSSVTKRGLFNLFGKANTGQYPIYSGEDVMSQKAHGTSEKPVQKDLRWNCDGETADRICNFNR